jgi:hypothetical protein
LAQPLPPPRHPVHERRADIHEAFTLLGCALICLKQIRRFGAVQVLSTALEGCASTPCPS